MLQENNNKVIERDLLELVYPVGSIYMSVNNVSPSNLFGGSWEQIEDTFLLAAGSTYTAGDTGGSATHTPGGTLSGGAVENHTLTKAEMPAHRHKVSQSYDKGGAETPSSGGYLHFNTPATSGSTGTCGESYASLMWECGGSQPHNHPFTQPTFTGTSQDTMPPYLTVYIWKRVS